MTSTLAEKLLVLYRTSRPLEYTETQGVAAIEWSQKILGQLTEKPPEETPPDFKEIVVDPNDPDPADLYTEQAIDLAAPIFSEWLDTLENHLFDGATDLAEVRDRIDSAFGEMPAEDFAELMSRVLVAGYGAGRYQVLEEAADDDVEFSEDGDEDIWLVFSEMPETATPITDKSALSLLKRLIDSVYLAGLTAIRYAYVDDNNNIRCGFEDRISPRQTLSFDAIINLTQISYGISELSASEPIWSEETLVEFATPATIKPRNCNPAKSFQCGNSCQKIGRNCKKNPSAGQKQAIASITETTTKGKKTTKSATASIDKEKKTIKKGAKVAATPIEKKTIPGLDNDFGVLSASEIVKQRELSGEIGNTDQWEQNLKDKKWKRSMDAPPPPPPGAEELAAIEAYAGSTFIHMNKYLRGEKSSDNDESLLAASKLAASGLAQLPSNTRTVYRGADLTPEVLAKYKVGKEVTEAAFISTSADQTMAFAGNTHYVIRPKDYGSRGADISDFSPLQLEYEVLFPPKAKFKVIGKAINKEVEIEGNKYQNLITLQEI